MGLALMEMLLDPVLNEWVPSYVKEEYTRWNPFFESAREYFCCKRPGYEFVCNRQLLMLIREKMKLAADAEAGKDAVEAADPDAKKDEAVISDKDDTLDDAAAEKLEREAMICDPMPSFDDVGGNETSDWDRLKPSELMSGGGPSAKLPEKDLLAECPNAVDDVAAEINPRDHRVTGAHQHPMSSWLSPCGITIMRHCDGDHCLSETQGINVFVANHYSITPTFASSAQSRPC